MIKDNIYLDVINKKLSLKKDNNNNIIYSTNEPYEEQNFFVIIYSYFYNMFNSYFTGYTQINEEDDNLDIYLDDDEEFTL